MSQQETRKGLITRGDVFASWWRWLFFSHANYNWERYQGTGFAHAMVPIIKKLYKTPEDIKAALKRHLLFFNTEPDTGGVIHGMVIALEEQRALGNTDIDDETITGVKSGLMGPLAGLGDTLKQAIWFTVWQSLGIGIALGGSILLGPLVYFLAASLYTFVFGWWVYYQGYVQGQALVTRFLQTGLLDDVRTGAAVLGVVVLGALAPAIGASFGLPLHTGLSFTIVSGAGGEAVTQTFALQADLFDKLFPSLLALVTVLLLTWALRRGIAPVTLIWYIFGITLGSVLIESATSYVVNDPDKSALAFITNLSSSYPTLLGMVVLIVGALWRGARSNNMRAAQLFVGGFVVVTIVFLILATGASAPIQILSHF